MISIQAFGKVDWIYHCPSQNVSTLTGDIYNYNLFQIKNLIMTTKTKSNIQLIVFQKSGAVSISYPFDINNTLAQVRSTLESDTVDNFMSPNDYFLNEGSKVLISTEKSIPLNVLLNNENTVNIGILSAVDPLDPKDGVQHYNDMSAAEKIALFGNIEIFNGLTFTSAEGFHKTFKKLYSWKNDQFPNAVTPRVLTEVEYKNSFSKVTNSLQETSTNSGSVSLNTPSVGGEAEFKYEQSKNTSSTEISEYITGKYLIRKIALQIDFSNFEISDDFDDALNTALHNNIDNDFQACKAVLQVLNSYGYYIPKEFNLGGALFTSDSTTISDYSESETNIQEFGGSFKGTFQWYRRWRVLQ